MSIAEQALILLDIAPSILRRKKLENFVSLDNVINASFPGSAASPPQKQETQTRPEDPSPNENENPYTVASRMSRSGYGEQEKAEALFRALRQMRAKQQHKNTHAGRVLRGN